ncbi:uncharacterized protein isoform X1 [Macaca fascicularis]|uniref:uncharacterized protein isoform X1 n=1 Tax=Macaca fascicularis TaxID=9541 RepID=UPI003D15E8A5
MDVCDGSSRSRGPAAATMPAAAGACSLSCTLHEAGGSLGQVGAPPLPSWSRRSPGAAAAAQTMAADLGFQLHAADCSPTLLGGVAAAQVVAADLSLPVPLRGQDQAGALPPWVQQQVPKPWQQTQASHFRPRPPAPQAAPLFPQQLQLPKPWLQTQASLNSWWSRKAPFPLQAQKCLFLMPGFSLLRVHSPMEQSQGLAQAP